MIFFVMFACPKAPKILKRGDEFLKATVVMDLSS